MFQMFVLERLSDRKWNVYVSHRQALHKHCIVLLVKQHREAPTTVNGDAIEEWRKLWKNWRRVTEEHIRGMERRELFEHRRQKNTISGGKKNSLLCMWLHFYLGCVSVLISTLSSMSFFSCRIVTWAAFKSLFRNESYCVGLRSKNPNKHLAEAAPECCQSHNFYHNSFSNLAC